MEGGSLVSKGWLAPMTLALLCAGSGWRTTASAQNADAQKNRLVFAVVVHQIFNQGNLALVDDVMAVDDVVTQGDRVIGYVTQIGGGASEGRIILLRIEDGVVHEYWSWAAEPGLPHPFGLRAGAAPHAAASAN
jgi:hypothetical protein